MAIHAHTYIQSKRHTGYRNRTRHMKCGMYIGYKRSLTPVTISNLHVRDEDESVEGMHLVVQLLCGQCVVYVLSISSKKVLSCGV